MYCVYKHTAPNGKVYIGITKKMPNERWRNGNGYKTNRVFFRAINKYGWENMEHEILFDGLCEEEARQKEIEFITESKSTNRKFGYNIKAGGDMPANTGVRLSEEHKRKIRESTKKRSESPCARQVVCLETLKVYGSIEDAKEATGASKICDCCKRVKKHRTSGGFHWAYYDPSLPMSHYEELLARYIEEESRPRVVSEKARRLTSERSSIPVKCIETGRVFMSLEEAAKSIGLSKSNICNCCRGNRRTAGGYHWQYA